MEYNPEYYKNQADNIKNQYETLEAKKDKTDYDDNRIQVLKQREAKYLEMYNRAIANQEILQRMQQRIQRQQQESKAQVPKTSNLIKLFKEKEEKRKREQEEQQRQEDDQLIRELDQLVKKEQEEDIDEEEKDGDRDEEEKDGEEKDGDEYLTPSNSMLSTSSQVPTLIESNTPQLEEPLPPEVVTNVPPARPTFFQTLKNKTKKNIKPQNNVKNAPKDVEIELKDFSKPKIIKTKKYRRLGYLGFRETLKNTTRKQAPPTQVNPDICSHIFTNGSKVAKKYFYPSEFPKLTNIKQLPVLIKKGGKRKSRKLRKNYKK
jgi:hypothetical protein